MGFNSGFKGLKVKSLVICWLYSVTAVAAPQNHHPYKYCNVRDVSHVTRGAVCSNHWASER